MKERGNKLIFLLVILTIMNLLLNLIYLNGVSSLNKTEDLKGELSEVLRIFKTDAICRIIGQDINSGRDIVSCFYGGRVDATREQGGEEITNEKILAFEELYFGGTFTDWEYNYDGEFIGKYRKNFFYNDNADVFWKVEVGLNGSTLEFCTMRDQEYGSMARTKESCASLNIDIQ